MQLDVNHIFDDGSTLAIQASGNSPNTIQVNAAEGAGLPLFIEGILTTAMSGTTATIKFGLQESIDGGTTWGAYVGGFGGVAGTQFIAGLVVVQSDVLTQASLSAVMLGKKLFQWVIPQSVLQPNSGAGSPLTRVFRIVYTVTGTTPSIKVLIHIPVVKGQLSQ